MSKVNHPAHYNTGKIEVIDAIEDWALGFNAGNAVKYVARAGKKDPAKLVEDLEKARWYLDREIERLKPGPPKDRMMLEVYDFMAMGVTNFLIRQVDVSREGRITLTLVSHNGQRVFSGQFSQAMLEKCQVGLIVRESESDVSEKKESR